MNIEIKSFISSVNGKGMLPVVALVDGEFAGSCLMQMQKDTGWLQDLMIDVKFRRKGIASSMVQHAVEVAENTGRYAVALTCNKKNEAAYALYCSVGFNIAHDYNDGDWMMTHILPQSVKFEKEVA